MELTAEHHQVLHNKFHAKLGLRSRVLLQDYVWIYPILEADTETLKGYTIRIHGKIVLELTNVLRIHPPWRDLNPDAFLVLNEWLAPLGIRFEHVQSAAELSLNAPLFRLLLPDGRWYFHHFANGLKLRFLRG